MVKKEVKIKKSGGDISITIENNLKANQTVPQSKVEKKEKISDEKEIFIDLSPNFNGIRSQGNLGACSAFSSSSIIEYYTKSDYLSPLFLWYFCRKILFRQYHWPQWWR